MFGQTKKKSVLLPSIRIPVPRAARTDGVETLLRFIEKCAGRRLENWEAEAVAALAKAVKEDEEIGRASCRDRVSASV